MGPLADSIPSLDPKDRQDGDALVDFTQVVPRVWITNPKDDPPDRWVDMITPVYEEVYEWPPLGGPVEGTCYMLITEEPDGSQTLTWKPLFTETGRAILIQVCQVTGKPPPGVHYVTPSFMEEGGIEPIILNSTGALGVAFYTILVDVGGVTYEVIVGYDAETRGFEIISYQIVE
ncbi:unnamed protein product [marine sediment metagenome]|uniref:Uncharacterized protein n=1 Tax=marine sediment metagenome TaxID=412755 RepID=X1N244_9ZZZZ